MLLRNKKSYEKSFSLYCYSLLLTSSNTGALYLLQLRMRWTKAEVQVDCAYSGEAVRVRAASLFLWPPSEAQGYFPWQRCALWQLCFFPLCRGGHQAGQSCRDPHARSRDTQLMCWGLREHRVARRGKLAWQQRGIKFNLAVGAEG